MSVVIAFEDAGPCRKQLTIEVPAPAVEAELGRVIKDWTRQAKIPGFRKGKAPASMIRSRFKTEIEQEVTERLVPRYWRQAEAEKSLDPLLAPEFSELKLEPGEPMTFFAEVETRPLIDLQLEPEVVLPTGDSTPTAEEIDEAIDEARRQHANWHDVDRAAAIGDRVLGTIHKQPSEEADEADADGEPEAPAVTPLDVELGDERVWEELGLALTGLSAGQKGTFTRKGEGSEAGEVPYSFEIETVRERELPPVDEDFAKKVGDFDSVDALRTAATATIAQRKAEHQGQERRKALLDELRNRHPLELPRRVVDHQVQEMLHRQMSRLAQQGIDLESAPIDWAGIGENMRPDAEELVHDRLILDAIAKEKDIQVNEEAFERLLGAHAAQQGRSPLALRQELSESGRLPILRGQLRRDQVVRVLLGDVSPEDTEPESEATDAEPDQEG